MHLNSSISSSRAGYIGTLFVTAALVVLAGAAVVILAKHVGRETIPNQALLDHQFGKIGRGTPPDIIFVGDSSLGNAIDSAEWSSLSGMSALNLALSGSYGYEGSYNMIRRVIDWRAPRHVVIMQTGEMMQRQPSEEAYIMTAPGLLGRVVAYWRMTMSAQQVENATLWLLSTMRRGKPPPFRESFIVNDYILQGPKRTRNPNTEGWSPRSVRADKAEYLNEIGRLCAEYAIDCIYVHGPLTEPVCGKSEAYFAEVAKVVQAAGIRLAQVMPPCVPEGEIGDGKDHVRPDLKVAYTRKYYDMIAPQLRR